mmetsp:Transcript_15971/g.50944  ORF Transcript_15971/g.50944 Transcript_15971/m.50944 type:complete len:203 (+) Transcript_15971:1-609(+)
MRLRRPPLRAGRLQLPGQRGIRARRGRAVHPHFSLRLQLEAAMGRHRAPAELADHGARAAAALPKVPHLPAPRHRRPPLHHLQVRASAHRPTAPAPCHQLARGLQQLQLHAPGRGFQPLRRHGAAHLRERPHRHRDTPRRRRGQAGRPNLPPQTAPARDAPGDPQTLLRQGAQPHPHCLHRRRGHQTCLHRPGPQGADLGGA